jgi:peptidoglycan/xylan/chitin deacetylase (PgdA/CDA1 family)
MKGKRALLAEICSRSGMIALLESLPKRNSLLVLNFHRIGNPAETPYDPGTFGPTAEEFEWQLSYLKRNFDCITLEEALAMVRGLSPLRPSLLLTFDDGYIDNYKLAFPLLHAHGLQAVFFLPTSFIGTQKLPWWDVIAYLIKHSRRDLIRVDYPEPAEFSIDRSAPDKTILSVLTLCLRNAVTDYSPLIEQLEEVCDCERPDASSERCFMNWDEAREMLHGGMAFGSHTHNHEVLSSLDQAQQFAELAQSRAILECELGCQIDVLSYPVGLPYTFNKDTLTALEQAEYQAAFSFYGGINCTKNLKQADIRRRDSHAASASLFRLQTTIPTLRNRPAA